MADEPKRVVITGVGVVSAAGPTAPDFWTALLDGRRCITPLEGPGIPRPDVAGQGADSVGPPGVPANILRTPATVYIGDAAMANG